MPLPLPWACMARGLRAGIHLLLQGVEVDVVVAVVQHRAVLRRQLHSRGRHRRAAARARAGVPGRVGLQPGLRTHNP